MVSLDPAVPLEHPTGNPPDQSFLQISEGIPSERARSPEEISLSTGPGNPRCAKCAKTAGFIALNVENVPKQLEKNRPPAVACASWRPQAGP